MKILRSSHFAATCDKYDSPAPNGSFARRCEAARSAEKNSITAKIFKYALTAALFLLATAFLIGAAAGYWIIVSRSDVPTSGICSYDSTNLLRYYLADESSDQFGKALDGDLGSASATYDGEPHFPIVSKNPIKNFDGHDKALLPLQFADFNSGGDLTQAYFADFGYEYVLLTGFSAGAKISPENIKTSAEILKNQSNYAWITGVPTNAGVYAVRITSLEKVTVAGSSATRSKYGSYIVIYTIAPATATITEAAPLSGSFITENTSSAQSAETMAADNIEGGDGTFIYGVDESGNPLNQGVKVTSLDLGGSSHSVSSYSNNSVGSVKNGLNIVLSDNVKSAANHSEAGNENFWYTVTASLSGAEAGNYALSNATSLRFRIAPVELNAADIKWYYGSVEATNGKTVVYNGNEHGLTAKIDETKVSNRYYAKYGNDESVKSAVKSLIDAINGGSAPLTLGVYARSNDNYTAAIPSTSKVAKNAGIYLFSADVYLGGERSTDVYLTAEAINTLKITAAQITVNYGSDLVYNGKEQKPTFALVGLVGNESMGVTAKVTQGATEVTPINVGSYTLTLSVSGETYLNYVFGEPTLTIETSTSHNYKITPKPVDITVTNVSNITYDGNVHAPAATYTDVNGTEVDAVNSITKDGSIINATDVKNAGAYTLTASLLDKTNYVWSDDKTIDDKTYNWTISKAKATLTTSNVSNITYDGKVHAPATTYTDVNGTTVNAVTAITKDGSNINANDVKNAGAYTLTASLKDKTNYVWSDTDTAADKTYNWTISKLKITVKVTNSKQSATYSGTEPTINTDTTVTLTDNGDSAPSFVSNELSFSVTKETGANVGTYALTPTVEAKSGYSVYNYDITCPTGTFTIKTAALTVTANSENITYGDDRPTFSVSYDGFVNNETQSVLEGSVVFACDYVRYGNAGSYSITPSGLKSDNYAITFNNGTLTVNKKQITATISLSSYSIYVTDYVLSVAIPSVTFSGLVNGDSLTVTYTATGSETTDPTTLYEDTQLEKGVYTINAVFSGDKAANYEITVTTATLTVKENDGAVTKVTAPEVKSGLVYNATEQVGITHNQANYADYYTVSGTASATNAGNYSVTVTLKDKTSCVWADDTTDDKTYNWTISKLKITVTVTNAEQSATYSGAEPTINTDTTVTPTDNGDSAPSFVSNELSFSVTKATGVDVGNYTLTPTVEAKSGYSVDNYTITTPTTGTFTISKAALTVTANSENITYGDEKPTTFSVSYSGFVNNETQGVLGGSLVFACDYVKYANVGSYSITPSGLTSGNYAITFENGTLTVGAATVEIPTAKQNLVYNATEQNGITHKQANYANYYTVSGTASATNAGEYTVKFALKNTANATNCIWSDDTTADKTVEWEISKLYLKFSEENKIIEINYGGSTTLSQDLLRGKLTPTNGTIPTGDDALSFASTTAARTYDNSDDDNKAYTETKNAQGNITSISGEHGYYKVALGSAFTVGSTYKVTAELDSGNYAFAVGGNTIIVKYKTAKIGTAYYTIEDALSASGDITLAGDSSGPATYVITSFTKLTHGELTAGYTQVDIDNYFKNYKDCSSTNESINHYTLSGKKLIVPYADGVTASSTESTDAGTNIVYSALIIPDDITLNISSTMNITAEVRHISTSNVCQVSARGVVMNNGTINVKDGANILAYGYLKGSGTVNLESGATATDLFRIFDFKGGKASYATYKKYFPINSYSLHNISCKTIVNSGSTYKAFYSITASSKWFNGTVNIIAPTSESNTLFKLSSGYIEKSAKPAASWTSSDEEYTALDTIVGSNQICGQIDVIDIHGVAVDGQVKISIKVNLVLFDVSVDMETSKAVPLPIAYMDITICKGAKMTLSNCSYKFMPGAKLTVEEKATLETASGVQLVMYSTSQCNSAENFNNNPKPFYPGLCVDQTDALLIVNGTATINGRVSGKILSKSKDAVLKITTNNTEITVLKSYSDSNLGSIETETTSANAIGNTVDGDNQTLENTTYKSQKVVGKFIWVKAGNIKTITFDSCGGTSISSKTIILTNGSFTIPATNEDGSAYLETPYLAYYTFAGWFTKKDGDDQIIVGSNISSESFDPFDNITLYAHWTPNTYQIVYEMKGDVPTEFTNPLPTSYTTGDEAITLQRLDSVTVGESTYTFVGWHYDSNCTQKADKIDTSVLGSFVRNESVTPMTLTVYGNWTIAATYNVTIKYVVRLDENEATVNDANNNPISIDNSQQQFVDGIDNNYTVKITVNGNDLDTSYGIENHNYQYYFAGYSAGSGTNGCTVTQGEEAGKFIIRAPNAGEVTIYVDFKTKVTADIQFLDEGNSNSVIQSTEKYFMPGNKYSEMCAVVVMISGGYDTIEKSDSSNGYKYLEKYAIGVTTNGSTIDISNDPNNETLLQSGDTITVTLYYRKIIKVTLNMSASAKYTHKFGWTSVSEQDKIEYFSINEISIPANNWYLISNTEWSLNNNSATTLTIPDTPKVFYILQGGTFKVTINSITITLKYLGSSKSHTFTPPAPSSCSNCSNTTLNGSDSTVYTFVSNSAGNIEVTWSGQETYSD